MQYVMRGVDGDDEATVSSRTVPPAYVPYNGMRTTGVVNLGSGTSRNSTTPLIIGVSASLLTFCFQINV